MSPSVAKAIFEKATGLDLSSPKGLIQDYRGWWAQCPRCKQVHGPYRSVKEAALKRICGACHFEEVMKLKRELERMGRGEDRRTTKLPWPLSVGEDLDPKSALLGVVPKYYIVHEDRDVAWVDEDGNINWKKDTVPWTYHIGMVDIYEEEPLRPVRRDFWPEFVAARPNNVFIKYYIYRGNKLDDSLWGTFFDRSQTPDEDIPKLFGESRQRRWNPSGIHRVRGQLVNKYGQPIEIDWSTFEKRREKVRNPLYAAAKVKKLPEAEELPPPPPLDPKAEVLKLPAVREFTLGGSSLINAYGVLRLAVREYNLGGRNVKGRKWARSIVDAWALPDDVKQAILNQKAKLEPSGDFDCKVTIAPT